MQPQRGLLRLLQQLEQQVLQSAAEAAAAAAAEAGGGSRPSGRGRTVFGQGHNLQQPPAVLVRVQAGYSPGSAGPGNCLVVFSARRKAARLFVHIPTSSNSDSTASAAPPCHGGSLRPFIA